jgi:NADPH:quinone reductase-like Zn-dependent oxidoreductase
MVYTEYGSPDVLQYLEVEKPAPGDNEVLVKVHAASVNEWDWSLLRGVPFVNRLITRGFQKPKVTILGNDIAGRVEAVGSSVTRFQPGDAVFGDISGRTWGGFAEYVCARESALMLKPPGMTFEEAAAIPHTALLALQGLNHAGPIGPGQNVLINGAGGGAGTFAIQLAKLAGAEVTGVDRAGKFGGMRSLGADHVIDFTQEDFTRNGRQYDRILDVAAYRSVFDYQRALSPGGAYVVVGGSMLRILQIALVGPRIAKTEDKHLSLLAHHPNQGLDEIIALFEAGKVKPIIDRRYPLNETAAAFQYYATGQAVGKIVITVDPS